MNARICRLATALFVCLWALAPLSPAQAGQLFPPYGLANPNTSPCLNDWVLSWYITPKGEAVVKCSDPSKGVVVADCPSGKVMNGIAGNATQAGGVASCVSINPGCAAGVPLISDGKGGVTCGALPTQTFTVGNDCNGNLCWQGYVPDADEICRAHGMTHSISTVGGGPGGNFYWQWENASSSWQAVGDASCTSTCNSMTSVTCQ